MNQHSYDPRLLQDPPAFRLKFFTELAEAAQVCEEKGPGDPAVGITSEDCIPHLEKIVCDNACGCATATYWCRHGHRWADLFCPKHALLIRSIIR